MLIEWIVHEKYVENLTIILREVDYEDDQKQAVELCANSY